MITSKSSKLSLLYITSLVLVNRKLGMFLLCRADSGVCWLKWNCDSYFPFLVFLPLISSVCAFPSDLYPASPGISSTAYRWASTADDRRWPRRTKAAFPREEPGGSIPLQTETQTVGQLPREESRGAQHFERLTVGEWASSGWMLLMGLLTTCKSLRGGFQIR